MMGSFHLLLTTRKALRKACIVTTQEGSSELVMLRKGKVNQLSYVITCW
jgi:hypothetical protein